MWCRPWAIANRMLLVLCASLQANSTLKKSARKRDRKSTRLNSSHSQISYAVFCLKKKSQPAHALNKPCYLSMLEGPPLAKALRPKLTEVFMQLTKRSYGVVGGLAALSLALALGVATKGRAGSRDSMTLPQHTPFQVGLDQPVSADRTKAGDRFAATVAQPVVVDGNTVIPKGARVSGVVVESRHGGRIKGGGGLRAPLPPRKGNGQNSPISTPGFYS